MTKPIISLLAAAALACAADVKMTNAERGKALQLLTDTEAEFLKSVEGLSDAQWTFKASPEKWSVGQTAEHIMLSEPMIFSAVQGAMKSPADPEWEAKSGTKVAMLEQGLPDRSHKATAPEPLVPQSKLTQAEVIEQYKAARAKTIAFAKTTDLPLKEHLLANPFFGPLNAYEWLIYVPLHNQRHNAQIAEVKASPGFPAH